LSVWQLFNMSCGCLDIQLDWGLQLANMSTVRPTGSPTGPGVTGLARGAEANPGAPWDVVMVGGACLLTAGLAWVGVAPDVGGERGHAGEAASTIP
jgi:hypothetical protein